MAVLGDKIMLKQEKSMHASTDMGNVSHMVPSFHGAFAIPTTEDVAIHNPGFTAAAGTDKAHESALKCANGMAMLAMRVLVDEDFSNRAWQDFWQPDE